MLTDLQKRKLTKFFSMYDANCGGCLVAQDFENIAKKFADLRGWGFRSPKYLSLCNQLTYDWKCLKSAADRDHDQKVCLDEWFNYYDEILGNQQKYAERVRSLVALVFEVFDENGDGKISQQEWSGLLKVYNVSPVYGAIVFPSLDKNHDGFLSKDEVLHLIHDFFYSDDPACVANSMFGPY
jgi:hypothetical protein